MPRGLCELVPRRHHGHGVIDRSELHQHVLVAATRPESMPRSSLTLRVLLRRRNAPIVRVSRGCPWWGLLDPAESAPRAVHGNALPSPDMPLSCASVRRPGLGPHCVRLQCCCQVPHLGSVCHVQPPHARTPRLPCFHCLQHRRLELLHLDVDEVRLQPQLRSLRPTGRAGEHPQGVAFTNAICCPSPVHLCRFHPRVAFAAAHR